MNLFLVFSGEGSTDHRFIKIIIERLIQVFLISKKVTAEFSWITIAKKGTSHDNILAACGHSTDHHIVFFHRDSGNNTWETAFQNHFDSAVQEIQNDNQSKYNRNLIPVIPVTETEAWMLVDKELLRDKIETDLSNNELGLTYKLSSIEQITDPKSVIENAISKHNETLTSKQRRYAVKIGMLYDIMASEIQIADLNKLNSFKKLSKAVSEILESITE